VRTDHPYRDHPDADVLAGTAGTTGQRRRRRRHRQRRSARLVELKTKFDIRICRRCPRPYRLRPVSFRYKQPRERLDAGAMRLIAEEVEQVLPARGLRRTRRPGHGEVSCCRTALAGAAAADAAGRSSHGRARSRVAELRATLAARER
jgi:hypothetical protein